MRYAALLLVLCACSGSPTAPGHPSRALETPWGTVIVYSTSALFADEIVSEKLSRWYEPDLHRDFGLRLDGLTITEDANASTCTISGRSIVCNHPEGVSHELGHLACREFGLSGCSRTYHAGGTDLAGRVCSRAGYSPVTCGSV